MMEIIVAIIGLIAVLIGAVYTNFLAKSKEIELENRKFKV